MYKITNKETGFIQYRNSNDAADFIIRNSKKNTFYDIYKIEKIKEVDTEFIGEIIYGVIGAICLIVLICIFFTPNFQTMKKNEILRALYKDNSLTKEDVYTDKRGFSVITRSGIEQIQWNNKIDVKFEIISSAVGNIIIKATSFQDGERKCETYGSASKENCFQKFPVEIAEKRALARVIIKTMGLTNTLGKDEVDHQQKNKTSVL